MKLISAGDEFAVTGVARISVSVSVSVPLSLSLSLSPFLSPLSHSLLSLSLLFSSLCHSRSLCLSLHHLSLVSLCFLSPSLSRSLSLSPTESTTFTHPNLLALPCLLPDPLPPYSPHPSAHCPTLSSPSLHTTTLYRPIPCPCPLLNLPSCSPLILPTPYSLPPFP